MAKKTKQADKPADKAVEDLMARERLVGGAKQSIESLATLFAPLAVMPVSWFILYSLYESGDGRSYEQLVGQRVMFGCEADYDEALHELVRLGVLVVEEERYRWADTVSAHLVAAIYKTLLTNKKSFLEDMEIVFTWHHNGDVIEPLK